MGRQPAASLQIRAKNIWCACVLCAIVAALVALLFVNREPTAQAQTPAAEKPISFIGDVAPILKENCFACHDAKRRSGKYDMTTFTKLLAGGAMGAPIVAGKPADSDFHDLMVTAEERRMPPRDKGEAVPKEKAAIIEKWIAQGAKLDTGIDPQTDLSRELRVRWKPPTPPVAYRFPAIINALAFAPDGKSIVVGGHHELTVWSLPEAKLLKRIFTRAERATAMAFARNGQLVVAGGRPGQEGDVRLYDLAAKPLRTDDGVEILDGVADAKVMRQLLVETDDSVLCIALSADGQRLAAGGCDRIVRIWDLNATPAKLEQTIENHADWVLGLAFTGDGKYLLSAARDKTAKVWDLKAKESVMTFPDHQNVVYAVAANKDGTLGFSIGADKALRVWKPAGDAKQLRTSGGHNDEVFKIAVSPKDGMLATASADQSVRLWDPAGNSSTKTLAGLTDHVFAVAFSPDGTQVAGGTFSGEVGIWKVPEGTLTKVFSASPGLPLPTPPKPRK